MFEEALTRDPKRKRTWIALVDGNNHQIDQIKKEARRRKLKVKILVDSIHVAEYLWGAAWSFFNEGDPTAERWVKDKQRALLEGNAGIVAASIRRKATRLGLDAKQRQSADRVRRLPARQAPLPRLSDRAHATGGRSPRA